MHDLEHRLRVRIDTLTGERDKARAQTNTLRRRRRKLGGVRVLRCVYCGVRTRCESRPAACPSHLALLDLDPHYLEAA